METTKGIGKAGPGRVEIRDKFTGDVIGEVTQDTRRDLRAKIHKAFQAREAVRETTFEERAELGHRVARKLEECRTELEDLMVREAGQPRQFARWEMERAIASARSLERRLELLKPRDLPAASGRNILYREPYGVVAVLPPRNTPLVVPLYTMLAALGAGNAVVEKPSRTVPLICQRVVQIAIDAGCPTESVQFSTCPGEEAAWEFIENREVDVLVHYASSPVGKDNLIKMGSYLERTKKTLGECMLHVGGRMKKYVPELAGNDPFIVLESADLAQASAAGLLGGFAHSGQLCIAAKRFLVQRSVASAFRDRLVEGITRLHVGDPSLEETDIGPIGKHESLDIARYQVQEALERGGRLLIGGRGEGPFFYPTLIEFEKTRILEGGDEEKPFLWIEESFAPVRSF
ncbi:MAG TPA: aldehyde dehydrogenase family protein, partial [Thermoanaerobaculia bacterium]|nr:aldehyde dehydrogenase family protein [Thermoanaerobaculia bacterium]